ncbi:hypothetical protein HK097_000525 [Rhizophlyctis rosea]|uniref:Uncharacterized protein n=1 Tax=Rhizophlyctis rosea TaxID=64517 RepID=A0AAD5S788_9FUNG|nr:hypothetical protein HK097_000525 [Rhizophlyctis rosea]
MATILRHLLTTGWSLTLSTNIGRRKGDKDTLFFHRSDPDPSAVVCSISFHGFDKMRLIGAPPQLHDAVDGAVRKSWKKVQDKNMKLGHPEWKLKGLPWWPSGDEEMVKSRILMARVFEAARGVGFDVYGGFQMTRGTKSDVVT